MPSKWAVPVLVGVALSGCQGTKCGPGTHEAEDGTCVSDLPATLTNTNTITTTITNTEPVTNTVTNTNTNTITNTTTVFTDTDPVLVPGHFEPVFDQLKKVLGNGGALGAGGAGQTHMHTNEVRYRDGDATHPPEMFNCSYTFSVVNATNPESVPYMAQGWTWPAAPDPDPSTSH